MNLKESLETINDSRIDRCKKHSLVDILMIVFFGLLCGYKSIKSIHLYADSRSSKACQTMRSHWGVENGLHWELDVVFGKDLSQLRKDNSAANMNIIRKLVINILKQTDFSEFTKVKSLSISGKQMLCDKHEECLEKVCRNI